MKVIIEDACSRPGNKTNEKAVIQVNQNTCVSDVIASYCDERGIRQKREYVLLNDKGEILNETLQISACGVLDEDVLYFAPKYADDGRTFGFSNYILLAVIALVIGVAGITAITILYVKEKTKPGPYDYGVAFDAGSTHTQLYVYRWSMPKVNNSGDVEQVATTKCKGHGISSYSSEPSAAGTAISTCLQSAQNYIPEPYQRYTPVYLGATAGMRLLHETNSSVSDAILSSIREVLARSGYQVESATRAARILTGQEEGTFSWLTANYLLNDLTTATSGALDMGGASTQITFIPDDVSSVPSQYRSSVLVHGTHYTVYTHSYLCYGKVEAERRHAAALVLQESVVGAESMDQQRQQGVIINPCLAVGANVTESVADIFKLPCVQKEYPQHTVPVPLSQNQTYRFVGTSNVSACYDSVQSRLFNFTSCHGQDNCTFNNVYQPAVNGHFYAFSSYYYTMEFLNLTGGHFSLDQVKAKIDQFCSLPYSEIAHLAPADYLLTYCFDAVYIYTLLVRGYKFDDSSKWDTLTFSNNVSGSELGWSLGFMLNETNSLSAVVDVAVASISDTAFTLLLILFVVFLLMSAAFACYTVTQGRTRNHTRNDYSRLADSTAYGTV